MPPSRRRTALLARLALRAMLKGQHGEHEQQADQRDDARGHGKGAAFGHQLAFGAGNEQVIVGKLGAICEIPLAAHGDVV